MKIENLKKVGIGALGLSSINSTIAIPVKRETEANLKQCELWQEKAISNNCVIPNEINTKELQRVYENSNEIGKVELEDKKSKNTNDHVDEQEAKKCKWNDYVGTTLALGSAIAMKPIADVVVTCTITGLGPELALPWRILHAYITGLPSLVIQKVFRMDEECEEIIATRLFEKYKKWKYED